MYDINNINIGETLRNFRKINRLTLSEVGNKLNRTKATISKYEKNEIIPDAVTLLKLCNALNISLSDLFPINEHINKFPFGNKLYLYYLKDEEIICSIINVFIDNYKYKAKLCNYSYDNNLEYCLDGVLEYDSPIISISLKNRQYDLVLKLTSIRQSIDTLETQLNLICNSNTNKNITQNINSTSEITTSSDHANIES